MADAFQACLAHVLRHEGGYVDHPLDPGGATNMGITRKTLAQWRGVSPPSALPKAEVKELTRGEAALIYRAQYWNPCRGDDMPRGIDLALFDYAVNSGPSRAVKALQTLVQVKADGIVGPITLAAVAQHVPTQLINALCDQRMNFLEKLVSFATFGRGWTSRVASVRKAALAMVGEQSGSTQTEGSAMLDGYKTYIVATIMLLVGLAQLLGIDLPAFESASAGNLIFEALAVVFLRKGLKSAIGQS